MTTFAAQLTSTGTGAISVVAVAGENARQLLSQLIVTPRFQRLIPGQILHSQLCHPEISAAAAAREPIDDALIVHIAPDHFEIHLHGGKAVTETVLATLEKLGAQHLSLDDPRIPPLLGQSMRAQVICALPRAQTFTAARLLAAQITTGLTGWARRWQRFVQSKSGRACDLWQLHAAAQWLSVRSRTLSRLLHPPRIAIIGPPNAGKSTLANALLGRPISITSDIAGTTRDWVDAQAIFQTGEVQVAVTLVDTAGVRETTDALEQLSIERSRQQAAAADVIILLLDASQGAASSFAELHADARTVIVWNKIDLLQHTEKRATSFPAALQLSARNHLGFDALMHAVLVKLDLHRVGEREPFAFTDAQQKMVEELARASHADAAGALLTRLIEQHATMPALTLILVTHDSTRWLRPFMESWQHTLARAPGLQAAGVDMILADSGSTDETLATAEALLPTARRLACGNIGFGAAVNRAVAAAQPSWLLICNPDLTFPPDFAAILAAILNDSKPGDPALVAPRLLNADGSAQPSVGKFPTIGSLISDQFRPRERRKYFFPQPTEKSPIDWASGACLLVSWNAFHAVKGFDERYFLYVEEVDFQRRLRNAGHAVWFVPELTVTHHHPNAARQPRPEVQRWAARGTLRYFARHAPLSLLFYRAIGLFTRRLTLREALASRRTILEKPTGP